MGAFLSLWDAILAVSSYSVLFRLIRVSFRHSLDNLDYRFTAIKGGDHRGQAHLQAPYQNARSSVTQSDPYDRRALSAQCSAGREVFILRHDHGPALQSRFPDSGIACCQQANIRHVLGLVTVGL